MLHEFSTAIENVNKNTTVDDVTRIMAAQEKKYEERRANETWRCVFDISDVATLVVMDSKQE